MALKQESAPPVPIKLPVKPANEQAEKRPPSKPAPEIPVDAFEKIRQYIKNNQLVRLRTNRPGKQVSMPCRILNFDDTAYTISVYHVDEKQVYTFNLNEIDEFV
ncbi:hypothetical protein D3C74_373240 [compost metagenome]